MANKKILGLFLIALGVFILADANSKSEPTITFISYKLKLVIGVVLIAFGGVTFFKR